MSNEKKHIKILGYEAKDKTTGFSGIITSVSFDLYGCVQAVLTPKALEGKILDGHWFDITRLEIISCERVMERPNFTKGYIAEGRKGAAEKPAI